jgi:hypothetical protein
MQAETMSCSLTGIDRTRRLRELREVASEGLLEVTFTDRGAKLRFGNTAATHADLMRLIDAESECCSFLSFDLQVTGQELLVEVMAPAGIHQIADLFSFSETGGAPSAH